MKGARLDWIRAVIGSILSASVIEYTAPPSLTDLPVNGLVTKSMLTSFAGGVIDPIVTNITGGTTANPITIAHPGMDWPTIILRNADGSNYAGSANSIDDGTSIILTGDDDGTGKFADSFIIILKQ